MSDRSIPDRVKNCLEMTFKSEMDFSGEDNLLQIGMDSMNFIRLIVYLEEEFQIEIDDDDIILHNFMSLEKIEQLVSRYVSISC